MAAMLQRSKDSGVRSMIITGGSLEESKHALELARELGQFTSPTVLNKVLML